LNEKKFCSFLSKRSNSKWKLSAHDDKLSYTGNIDGTESNLTITKGSVVLDDEYNSHPWAAVAVYEQNK
jgi:hypothetical protein